MKREQQEYVEEIGIFFERFGLARMIGRVLGVLLLRPREHSAEELAGLLHASRGSISQATRVLVEWGLVRRASKPGERRDYFSVRPGAWEEVMRREIGWISSFREMADRGLDLADGGSASGNAAGGNAAGGNAAGGNGAGTGDRLEEMRDFFAYLEQEYPAMIARWEAERREERR